MIYVDILNFQKRNERKIGCIIGFHKRPRPPNHKSHTNCAASDVNIFTELTSTELTSRSFKICCCTKVHFEYTFTGYKY